MHICVCICTYKRPRLVKALLLALGRQDAGGEFTMSVVVADNDRAESACAAVSEAGQSLPFAVTYCVEPDQNIAKARNKAVCNSVGDFIAFIDDDELPPSDWLRTALHACVAYGADGVLAPVRPVFECEPPEWLVKGGFCDRPEHETGYALSGAKRAPATFSFVVRSSKAWPSRSTQSTATAATLARSQTLSTTRFMG